MTTKKRRPGVRNKTKTKRGKPSAATKRSLRDGARRATWEALFGHAEALRRAEGHFERALRGEKAAPKVVVPPGQVEALIGIWWVDPTFPIFHDLIVNLTPLGVGTAKGGDVVIPILLRRGQANVVDWSIHHFVGDTGQGWQHRMFIKFDDHVEELESATDKTKSKDDDVTSGQRIIHVPA